MIVPRNYFLLLMKPCSFPEFSLLTIVQAKVKMNESVVFEDFILLFGIESQMNVTLDCRVSKLGWIQGKHMMWSVVY